MISLLVAMDRNHVIGFENDMPWHLPRDLKHFKEKTTGYTIIMGRKTFDSIGKALPNRKNIVLTRQKDYSEKDVEVIHLLDEIYEIAEENPDDELFIIGGGNLYEQVLPRADRMYITKIDEAFNGDTHFPAFFEKEWSLTNQVKGVKDSKNPYDYYFQQYDRIE